MNKKRRGKLSAPKELTSKEKIALIDNIDSASDLDALWGFYNEALASRSNGIATRAYEALWAIIKSKIPKVKQFEDDNVENGGIVELLNKSPDEMHEKILLNALDVLNNKEDIRDILFLSDIGPEIKEKAEEKLDLTTA